MKSKRITTWILVAMVLGIGTGYLCNRLAPDAGTAKEIAGYFSILTDIFLRLIKMIIAPLVFSTLVAGIARTGDTKAVGRIGLKALGWFITASLVSLLLGMLLVNVLEPGHDLGLPLPEADAATNPGRSRRGAPTCCCCRRPRTRWRSASPPPTCGWRPSWSACSRSSARGRAACGSPFGHS